MPEIVASVIDVYPFRRDGSAVSFLLLKRAPDARVGGTWQAVHGGIDAGETAWEAALRELLEETSVRPTRFWQLEFVNTFYMASRDQLLMCPCFAAELAPDAEVVLSPEHTEYRWESYEQARQVLTWPGERRAIREIVEEIVDPGPGEPFLRIPLE